MTTLLPLTAAFVTVAGAGFFKDFVVIDRGTGDEYYDTGGVDNTFDFQGLDLGPYCPNGTPLLISGGEANTFQNGPDDVGSTRMFFTTYETGNRPANPNFTEVNLFFQSQTGNPFGGIDKTWRTTSQGYDVSTGLAAGDYSVEVYFEGTGFYSGGSFLFYDSNNGFNYVANYQVTPDPDGDCINAGDNCPAVSNVSQADADSDGVGDVCDNCPGAANNGQADSDADGAGDACDVCPGDPLDDQDNDGVCGDQEVCDTDPNKTDPGACGCGFADTDTDSDGIADCNDSCENDPDNDLDNDGVCGDLEVCDDDPNKTDPGVCGCGTADTDTDSDGFADCVDNCVAVPNDQTDSDNDGTGDACEVANDADDDGVEDEDDACPDSPPGFPVDADGCAGSEIVDANCHCDNDWKNHGKYVSCVAQTVDGLVDDGLLTEDEGDAIVSGAAQSDCGKSRNGNGNGNGNKNNLK